MSAWPEAAWIVNKLQKNFDVSAQIVSFNNSINGLNGQINTVGDNLETFINNIDTTVLSNQVITIASVNQPSTSNVKNGAIWFKVRS